jgi:hypothetical protein
MKRRLFHGPHVFDVKPEYTRSEICPSPGEAALKALQSGFSGLEVLHLAPLQVMVYMALDQRVKWCTRYVREDEN